MILIFDAETTGLYRRDLPAVDASQPEVVQLAAALVDRKGAIVSRFGFYLRSDTAISTSGAAAVHGITQAVLTSTGIRPQVGFAALADMAQCARGLAAYGILTQVRAVESAMTRLKAIPSSWRRLQERRHCLMQPLADLHSGGRWLSLRDAAALYLARNVAEAGDASRDLTVSIAIAQKMMHDRIISI
jgi:hypothetical protein